MNAPEPTRRRWLIDERNVVTVLALVGALPLIWLAWESTTVGYRSGMRAQIEASGARFTGFPATFTLDPAVRSIRSGDRKLIRTKVRCLIGDEEIYLIEFNRRLTADDLEAIEAFPEAYVLGIPDSPPPPAAPSATRPAPDVSILGPNRPERREQSAAGREPFENRRAAG